MSVKAFASEKSGYQYQVDEKNHRRQFGKARKVFLKHGLPLSI